MHVAALGFGPQVHLNINTGVQLHMVVHGYMAVLPYGRIWLPDRYGYYSCVVPQPCTITYCFVHLFLGSMAGCAVHRCVLGLTDAIGGSHTGCECGPVLRTHA